MSIVNILTSTLLFFQSRCEEFKECVDENNLQCFSEFIFETFMKHYRLYQYVVECQRDRDSCELQMSVNVPPDILPLSEGKEESVWNYEQKLKEVEIEEGLVAEKKHAAFEEVKCKDGAKIECAYRALDTLPNDTKQKVQPMYTNSRFQMLNFHTIHSHFHTRIFDKLKWKQ